MKKRILMLLSGILILGMVLAACGPKETTVPTSAPDVAETPFVEPTKESDEPVVLRIGLIGEPDCLHPFICSTHWVYNDLIYEGFSQADPNYDLVPRLAKSLEASEDGLTWTITLQEGVTFSDGMPFNAQTLKEHWDWVTSIVLAEWYPETLFTVSSEAVDETTFKFTTAEPIGTFAPYNSMWIWPLPPQIWGEFDDSTVFTFENTNPIGTGPFVLTEWVVGQHLIFDAREDYWGGKPPIDRIVMQVYSNWDAIVQALIEGEIDVTDILLPAQYYDTLVNAPGVTVTEQPPGFHYYVVFNMAEYGVKHPAIDDPAVRKAIDYAIDRQQVIDVALLGHGILCPTDWACGPLLGDLLDPSRTVTPFDLTEAKQILEEAGYSDTNGDGVRETADGEPLEFRLFFDINNPTQDVIARMLSDWLSEIGITVLVESQEIGTMYEYTLGLRDFDLLINYWPDERDPAGADFYYSCWSADAGQGALNWPGLCDPVMDDLIWGLTTTIGWENRQPLAYELGEYFGEVRPVITIAGENFLQAYRSDRFNFGLGNPTLGGLWDGYSIMRVEVIE